MNFPPTQLDAGDDARMDTSEDEELSQFSETAAVQPTAATGDGAGSAAARSTKKLDPVETCKKVDAIFENHHISEDVLKQLNVGSVIAKRLLLKNCADVFHETQRRQDELGKKWVNYCFDRMV
jgi:hypothetical protein